MRILLDIALTVIAVPVIIAIIIMFIPSPILLVKNPHFLVKNPHTQSAREQASRGQLGKTCPGAQRRITAEC